MFKKSILAMLIDQAVEDCYSYGSGRAEDEENNTGLRVTADWTECGDPEYESVIEICVFQNNVLKLSYEDPETKCN